MACLVDEQLNSRIYDRPPAEVRSGDIVMDGGAHVGAFARLAFGKGARHVFAFEPDPRNAKYPALNFQQESKDGRFVLVPKALWNRSGSLNMSLGDRSAETLVSEEQKPFSSPVATTTMDEIVREYGLEHVDFIKLDIEGAEQQALAGSRSTLFRFAPRMVVCTHHRVEDPVGITALAVSIQNRYLAFGTQTQAYLYPSSADTAASRQGRRRANPAGEQAPVWSRPQPVAE